MVALIKELKAIGVEDVSVADGAVLDPDVRDQLKDVEAVGGRVSRCGLGESFVMFPPDSIDPGVFLN